MECYNIGKAAFRRACIAVDATQPVGTAVRFGALSAGCEEEIVITGSDTFINLAAHHHLHHHHSDPTVQQ